MTARCLKWSLKLASYATLVAILHPTVEIAFRVVRGGLLIQQAPAYVAAARSGSFRTLQVPQLATCVQLAPTAPWRAPDYLTADLVLSVMIWKKLSCVAHAPLVNIKDKSEHLLVIPAPV